MEDHPRSTDSGILRDLVKIVLPMHRLEGQFFQRFGTDFRTFDSRRFSKALGIPTKPTKKPIP